MESSAAKVFAGRCGGLTVRSGPRDSWKGSGTAVWGAAPGRALRPRARVGLPGWPALFLRGPPSY